MKPAFHEWALDPALARLTKGTRRALRDHEASASMRYFVRMVALAVVLATNEARSDPAATMPPVTGSRLTPIYLAGEDESRQFVGWYDTARLESCSFAVSGDGVLRCLPTDAIEARLFTDAACTRRIAALSSCAVPKYLVESEANQCATDTRRHLAEKGARIRPAAVYAHTNGACVREPLDPEAMYVMVGRKISPDSFVAARYQAARPQLLLKTEYQARGHRAGRRPRRL